MLRIICLLVSILMFASLTAQEISGDAGTHQDSIKISGAEIIMHFQKLLAADQQRLIRMNSRSARLAREIDHLTDQFNRLDAQLQAVTDNNGTASEDKVLQQVLSSLDLHLRSRQAILQQITIVQNKIKKQKEVVDYVTLGQIPVIEDSVNLISFTPGTGKDVQNNSEVQNRKELAALADLQSMEAELIHARQNLLKVDQLIIMNKSDLELTKVVTEVSGEMMVLLEKQTKDQAVRQQQLEVSRRISQDNVLMSDLKARIQNLTAFRDPMVEAVSEAEEEVDDARSRLEFLQSSMAPQRVLHWLKSNIYKIAIILVLFFGIWMAGRWVVKVILNRMIRSKSNAESADRLETIKLASGSIITIFAVLGGFIVLLSEIGVDLTVVLGGAAVFSLVIAFGAQSLVKDYLSGFIILLENQYRAGNVVKINETTGIVENMTLRLTVLRDLEGITHFIPHGQILNISNLTHLWSRVMFDIGVSYNENVDEVIDVLKELASEMKEDPEYSNYIIEEMEMLGVDKFSESAIVIKFLVKTRPLKQWIVKRELLRRIKNRFDELGIEIPFPHLTVYHRDREMSPESMSPAHDAN